MQWCKRGLLWWIWLRERVRKNYQMCEFVRKWSDWIDEVGAKKNPTPEGKRGVGRIKHTMRKLITQI